MSLVMVGKWVKQFAEERTDVHYLQCSGQPSNSMSFNNVQQRYDLLEENRCVPILELCFYLQIIDYDRSSVHKIVHNVLGF